MILEGTINVVGIDVVQPAADEDGNIPENATIFLSLTLGMGVPVPQQTPEGVALVVTPIPAAVVRVPLNAEAAAKVAEELAEVAAMVPVKEETPASDIVVANQGMANQVIAQAKAVESMKKGKKA